LYCRYGWPEVKTRYRNSLGRLGPSTEKPRATLIFASALVLDSGMRVIFVACSILTQKSQKFFLITRGGPCIHFHSHQPWRSSSGCAIQMQASRRSMNGGDNHVCRVFQTYATSPLTATLLRLNLRVFTLSEDSAGPAIVCRLRGIQDGICRPPRA